MLVGESSPVTDGVSEGDRQAEGARARCGAPAGSAVVSRLFRALCSTRTHTGQGARTSL